MSSIGTGSTTSTDATVAAAELVERAKAGLEGTPTLAILFATTHPERIDALVLASAWTRYCRWVGRVPFIWMF